MVRGLLWLVAISLGTFAGRGFSVSVGSQRGGGALAAVLVSELVVVFVMVSIVTAMEAIFPSLRRRRVRSGARAR